ncbi:hypothetical protein BXZ70DRAFT_950106 [Cristinia sonorae]|uniref:Uncharacterized protein n=1 Tax=Cristinia sonorae TaxID=1940300 RepID=A0A8K0UI93_9AGAR|nr:hypothetical protein BXZ70DRAFT_950106 [Cristinia sonorae]
MFAPFMFSAALKDIRAGASVIMPIPSLPQELIDAIIDCLALPKTSHGENDDTGDDPDAITTSFESCALVTDTWMPRALFHLQNTLTVCPRMTAQKLALLHHPMFPSFVNKLIMVLDGVQPDFSDGSAKSVTTSDTAAMLGTLKELTHFKISGGTSNQCKPSRVPLSDGISSSLMTHLVFERVIFDSFAAFSEIISRFPALESLSLLQARLLQDPRNIPQQTDPDIFDIGTHAPPRFLKTLRAETLDVALESKLGPWLNHPDKPCSIESFTSNLSILYEDSKPLLEWLSSSVKTIRVFTSPNELWYPGWMNLAWSSLDKCLSSEAFSRLRTVHLVGYRRDAEGLHRKFQWSMPGLVQKGIAITEGLMVGDVVWI